MTKERECCDAQRSQNPHKKQGLFLELTDSSSSTFCETLTAFRTSNKTAAVWYAFVSCALSNSDKRIKRARQERKTHVNKSAAYVDTWKEKGCACSPVSFIGSILKSLDVLLVVVLVEALHLPRIALFHPPLECGIVFLTRQTYGKHSLHFNMALRWCAINYSFCRAYRAR